ncbi:MAG TPA: peptide chain release factor 3, partial [Bacteroidetes bacterium]|nr:peptide chain release factor 3 [Bacteroidota bacterium]
GPDFKGVYNIFKKELVLFKAHGKQSEEQTVKFTDLNDYRLDDYIAPFTEQLREDIELIEGVYDDYDNTSYLNAEIAPVFFGSAINNFGVKELLDCFIEIAPSPGATYTDEREVNSTENKFSGFIFKIHANMDPKHRDRIAFLRICSGTFERNKNYLHIRSNKNLKFSSPTSFMAEKKEIIDVAYPGDIVGLHDTGNFKIGDSLTSGEVLHFKGIPSFSPELFRYIENADPLKFKQLAKGIEQLMDEGVAQLFTSTLNNRKIIGTVGALQFEVIQYRLEHEYGAKCRYEPIRLHKACWLETNNEDILKTFIKRKFKYMALDKDKRHVYLSDSAYGLNLDIQEYPEISFHFKSEY